VGLGEHRRAPGGADRSPPPPWRTVEQGPDTLLGATTEEHQYGIGNQTVWGFFSWFLRESGGDPAPVKEACKSGGVLHAMFGANRRLVTIAGRARQPAGWQRSSSGNSGEQRARSR